MMMVDRSQCTLSGSWASKFVHLLSGPDTNLYPVYTENNLEPVCIMTALNYSNKILNLSHITLEETTDLKT